MSQIKVNNIVSFSSEDSNYPASNLLSNDIVNKKWIGQKGETSNSVVLQLNQPTLISQVHIGTYHSAFIEVLVGRSEASSQSFEVLICASSFMNPSDSRNSENISRVKTFSGEQLAADTRNKKWDRVRVVCTQPYNKHVQFGLSFINFFSSNAQKNDAPSSTSQSSSQNSLLGRFRIRNPSSDEDDNGNSFKPGELFARLKQKGKLSTDAQIRQAGTPDNLNSKDKNSTLLVKASRPKIKPSNSTKQSSDENALVRSRNELIYDDDDEAKNDKIDRIMERDKEEKAKLNESKRKTEEVKKNKELPSAKKHKNLFDDSIKNTPKTKTVEDKNSIENSVSKKHENDFQNTSSKVESKRDRKRPSSLDSSEPSSSKKPCRDSVESVQSSDNIIWGPQCLRGVVFVLSGYVNPKRSTLRDAGISLGARYSPDWGTHCTHLICAFPNTPKHEQIKRSGANAIVVSGQWIEDCHKEQGNLPWKWYAMDPKQRISRPTGPLLKPQDKGSDTTTNTTNLEPVTSTRRTPVDEDSDFNTDDEIEKVLNQQKLREVQQEPNKISPSKNNLNIQSVADSGSDTDIDEGMIERLMEEKQKQTKGDDKDIKKDKSAKKATKTVYLSDDDNNTRLPAKTSKSPEITDYHKKRKTSNEDDSKWKSEDEDAKYSMETPLKKNKNHLNHADVTDSDNNCILDSEFDGMLPDLFSGIKFYVDPKIEKQKYDPSKVVRYILAYKGEVIEDWPNKKVDVAITTESHIRKLRFEGDKRCQYLRPEWIWKCNDAKTLNSFEPYKVKI